MLKLKSTYKFFENTFSLFALKWIDISLAIFLISIFIVNEGIDNYGRYAFGVSFLLFHKKRFLKLTVKNK